MKYAPVLVGTFFSQNHPKIGVRQDQTRYTISEIILDFCQLTQIFSNLHVNIFIANLYVLQHALISMLRFLF